MTVYVNNSLASSPYIRTFRADVPPNTAVQIVTKPIEKVENIVNTTVDTFVPEAKDEETKKSHKTAIKVLSTVFVVSGLAFLLNPKFLTKWSDKMSKWATKAGNKALTNDSFLGKICGASQNTFKKTSKVLKFSNNFNSVKDESFKWLCGKTKLTRKPHEVITKWFDKISRQTVYRKYSKITSNMETLNKTFAQYKSKLTLQEQELFDTKLKEIINSQKYFSKDKILERLNAQEVLMADLEEKTVSKMKSYGKGLFLDKNVNKKELIKNNMSFWAEDILMPERKKLEQAGENAVKTLVGDGKNVKGSYYELLDIVAPRLKEEEKAVLEEAIKKTSKKLRSANMSECVEYFDKKRDLMLGSAPTDILTGLIALGLSGVAIGRADTKDDRISRAITVAFPAVAGFGVSTALAAFLYSGVKGMFIGSLASGALSLAGNTVDKQVFRRYQAKKQVADINIPKEVKNA